MHVVGLDIGGANLKAASSSGEARSENFEIWRNPDQLTERLAALIVRFPPADAIAVTMTAELADCFETKADGVNFILRSAEQAAGKTPIHVWQTSGNFVSAETARQQPRQTAAANWHALATWAGRFVPEGKAVLIDIGSTTTDIIPFQNGKPVPQGLTDTERLMSGELVYSGVRRTPLRMITGSVPYREGFCSLAAEVFATTLDVYLTLKEIPENPGSCNTANGRPATIAASRDRLARMICADRTEFTEQDAIAMSAFIAQVHCGALDTSLRQALAATSGPCDAAVISGEGEFLARRVLREHEATRNCRIVSLSEQFHPALAEAACAYAIATLLHEKLA